MISIIMSTYNEPLSLVKKSVESILTQSFKDFEFIIILDNPKNFEVNNYIKSLSESQRGAAIQEDISPAEAASRLLS